MVIDPRDGRWLVIISIVVLIVGDTLKPTVRFCLLEPNYCDLGTNVKTNTMLFIGIFIDSEIRFLGGDVRKDKLSDGLAHRQLSNSFLGRMESV